jgi:hypothetical protein
MRSIELKLQLPSDTVNHSRIPIEQLLLQALNMQWGSFIAVRHYRHGRHDAPAKANKFASSIA